MSQEEPQSQQPQSQPIVDQNELQAARDELSRAQKELINAKNEIDNVEKQINQVKREKQELQSELDASLVEIAEAKSEITKLNQEKADMVNILNFETNSRKDKNPQNDREKSSFENESIEDVKKELDDARKQIEKLNKENQDLQTIMELEQKNYSKINMNQDKKEIIEVLKLTRNDTRTYLESLYFLQTGKIIDFGEYNDDRGVDEIDQILNPTISIPEPDRNTATLQVLPFLDKIEKIRLYEATQILTLHQLYNMCRKSMTEPQKKNLISNIQSKLKKVTDLENCKYKNLSKLGDETNQRCFMLADILKVPAMEQGTFKAITGLEKTDDNREKITRKLASLLKKEDCDVNLLSVEERFNRYLNQKDTDSDDENNTLNSNNTKTPQ